MKSFKLAALLQLLALGACASFFSPGLAAELPGWRFDELLQATLAGHPALQGKRAEQAAAQSDLDGAKWQRFPSVSVERAVPSAGGQTSAVRLDQPLWDGGRISAGIDAAGSRYDAAGAAADEQALALSLRVIAAYTEALRQQARQQYAADGVAQHRQLLEMIGRRVAQDVSSQTDLRLAESRLYAAINDQSVSEQALTNALVQLSGLTGAAVRRVTRLSLDGGVNGGASLDAAQAQALAFSPTLRRLAFENAAAGAEIAGRRAAWLPQVALRLEKTRGQVSDSRIMLVLQAQPGAGLSALSAVSAATARRDAVYLASAAAERDTRERLALDWSELQAARERLDNASRASEMSGQVFDSYTRQYVIGRKTWSEVLNAVRELTQAQFALEDARAQAMAAALRLRAQQGTLRQGRLPATTP